MLDTSGLVFDLRPGVADRFWAKVEIAGATDCWNWRGSISRGRLPYGKAFAYINKEKHSLSAHRVAWAIVHGRFPYGHIDHLCNNYTCVNPAHLDDVTRQENMDRLMARGRNFNASKQACPRGHAYDKVRRRSNGRGVFRYCSACSWDVEKERRARVRAGGQSDD
jgi:HNH endonuclease